MITTLSIKNALIENYLDFPRVLSIITGETGAGKSIILGISWFWEKSRLNI
jgi:DNA repair ATPase RecN